MKSSFINNYWQEKVAMKDSPDVAVVGNRFYIIGEKNAQVRGFHGQRFTIKFFDGRIVETDNLWNGEEIADQYRAALPNNAEFVPS